MTDQSKVAFRAGDRVHHGPSDETWILGRADAEHVEPFGWPRSQARAADCRLIQAATDKEHAEAAAEAQRVWGWGMTDEPKVSLRLDEWVEVAEILIRTGRKEVRAKTLELAARILEAVGASATAGATRTEAQKMAGQSDD